MSTIVAEDPVVVIGGGHNGLVAAAYLARAGRRVELFERRGVLGGCCVTEELIPGARFSSCAHIVSSLHGRIVEELELEAHGLSLYAPDLMNFVMDEHGEQLWIWPELDRTLAELDRRSAHDSRSFTEFSGRLYRLASRLRPYLLEAPPPLSKVVAELEHDGMIEIFHEYVTLSIGDLVDRYFEDELLKGLFAFSGLVSAHSGPYSPGTSYEFSHHAWGDFRGQFGRFGFARGGMGAIADAIASAARAAGARLHTSAPVRRILVEHGRARGVELADGTRVAASLVVSNADPRATLHGLLGGGHLSRTERARVEAIDMRGSMALVHLLTDRLPQYLGTGEGEGPQHRGFTLLGTTLREFERCWQAQQRGELVDGYPLEVTIQSTTDVSLAPAGMHTVTVGVQQLPFELSRGDWDDRREEFTERVLASFERFAPGVGSSIKGSVTITPLDLSREYGLTGGNIFHGAMTLPQMFASRPLSGWDGYATPIAGLYLCGAGTHPGGAVMGACGHNAAGQILGKGARRGDRPPSRFVDWLLSSEALSPLRHSAARRAATRRLVERVARR